MRARNLPTLDGRYWNAMVVASVLGTTAGDFVSNSLALGFAGALLPLGVLFGGVLIAERRAIRGSEAYYWIAIVIARMMATNLGDFVARTLKLGYGWVSLADAVLFTSFLLMTQPRASASCVAQRARLARKQVPTIDTRYWIALLLVSVMGTNGGDFFSSDTSLGYGGASLLLGALLAAALTAELGAGRANQARYWAVVAIIRTTGTVMGDYLTNGLHLGFALGASLVATLLVVVLVSPLAAARRFASLVGVGRLSYGTELDGAEDSVA